VPIPSTFAIDMVNERMEQFPTIDGVSQAIFPGGDGWLYSFLAEPSADKKPKLLWKFDCNPKDTVWKSGGMGNRNNIIATPVVYDGLVYIATGQDPENGGDQGDLWCIDPRKRGDVSLQLVVDKDGKPVPPRRKAALDAEAGETAQANPNSAVVWHYRGHDDDGDGKYNYKEQLYRTLSMVAIGDNVDDNDEGESGPLLVIPDNTGFVHCLDAKTGKFHWSYDMMAAVWGSPLLADGKIYIGNEDGDMIVFELSTKLTELAANDMGDAIYGSPVAVDGVIYVATRTRLIAIGSE
jgi:outer membrane protein assembly factor BamB